MVYRQAEHTNIQSHLLGIQNWKYRGSDFHCGLYSFWTFSEALHTEKRYFMYCMASPYVFWEKWYFRCPLEGAFCHSPEKCLSLLRGHVLTCLQKIGHYQRLLNGLCFHPHSAIHSNNHLKGENLLQVLHYFTLRSQKSNGRNNTFFILAF